MAFGNSDGDLQMLQWTTAGDGPRFGLIVHHTDAEREWAYDRDSHIGRLDKALDAAGPAGWVVVVDEGRLEDDLCGGRRNEPDSSGVVGRWPRRLPRRRRRSAQQAEPPASPGDRWTVEVAPYLWIASMDGNATVGGIKSDVDVPFSDILKDLSFGAMLAVDVEKGRFGIGVNGLFARVSSDSDVGPIEIDATSDSGQLAVLPFYRVVEWQYGVSSSGEPLRLVVAPEAGFRYTYMRTELEVRRGPTVDGSESWVDPLIGSRIGLELTDRWAIIGEGNFGGFGVGSDFTWNAQAYLGYRTSLFGRPTTFLLGYRALLSGLRPRRLRVGRDHARPGARRGDAVLNASHGGRREERRSRRDELHLETVNEGRARP